MPRPRRRPRRARRCARGRRRRPSGGTATAPTSRAPWDPSSPEPRRRAGRYEPAVVSCGAACAAGAVDVPAGATAFGVAGFLVVLLGVATVFGFAVAFAFAAGFGFGVAFFGFGFGLGFGFGFGRTTIVAVERARLPLTAVASSATA